MRSTQTKLLLLLTLTANINSNQTELSNCLIELQQRYRQDNTITLHIQSNIQTTEYTKTWIHYPNVTLCIFNINQLVGKLYTRSQSKPSFVIMYIENLELQGYKEQILWSREAKVIIITRSDVTSITSALWTYTKSLNMIVLSVGEKIQVFTLFPYDCYNRLKLLDVWFDGKFEKGVDLFPRKIPNKFECTVFNMPIISHYPYSGVRWACGDGIQHTQATTILQHLNLTVTYTFVNVYDHFSRDLNINSSSGLLYRRETDLITSLTVWQRFFEYGDIVPSYIPDDTIWVIPRAKPKPIWANLVRPFSLHVWIILLFVTFFLIFFVWLIGLLIKNPQFSSFFYCFIYTNGFLFQRYFFTEYDIKALKLVSLVLLIYTMVVSAAYEGSIVKLLTTTDYFQQYETLRELVEDKFNFYMYTDVFNDTDSDYFRMFMLPHRYTQVIDSYVMYANIIKTRREAAMTNTLFFTFFVGLYLEFDGQPAIECLPERILTGYTAFYMPINHPLYERISRASLAYGEAGLIGLSIYKMARKCRVPVVYKQPARVLSLGHLQGLFYVYLIGMLICTLVFICEMSYDYFQNPKPRKEKRVRIKPSFNLLKNIGALPTPSVCGVNGNK